MLSSCDNRGTPICSNMAAILIVQASVVSDLKMGIKMIKKRRSYNCYYIVDNRFCSVDRISCFF